MGRSATPSSSVRSGSGLRQDKKRAVAQAIRPVLENLEQRVMLAVGAPSLVVANPPQTPGSGTSNIVLWRDNADNETHFDVERSTDGTNFNWLATLNANTQEYVDTSAPSGAAWYRLQAGNDTEHSAYSPVAQTTQWTSANVGTVTGGSWNVNSGTVTVVTKGGGIGGSSDDFRMVYTEITGDATLIAKVATVQNTNSLAKAGIMFRNSLVANSRNVLLAITPSGSAQWQRRTSDGSNTETTSISGRSAPQWAKIVREGSRFTAYLSTDGTSWTQVGQNNVSMNATLYVGLALSSSGYGADNTSTFSDVSATWQDHALPVNWGDQDVGSATLPGSARYYDETESPAFTFAVEASGQNVGGTSDTFHFAHRTLIGDGEFITRVASVQNGGYAQAKAGIMFRDGLATNAPNVFLAISAGNGAVWQYRSTTGGNTTETWSSGKSAPYWVKIKRAGNTFTGYLSTDGSTWSQIGSAVTISMSSSLEVGLALSAAGYGSLNTSTFDNVKFAPASPVLTASAIHGKRIDLSWTDNCGSTSGYLLERSSDNGATWTAIGGEIHATSYVDNTVDPETSYLYHVKGYIDDVACGESAWSTNASASTVGLGIGLAATYSNNVDFTGTTVSQVEQEVNFSCADGQSPVSGVDPYTFSAEWKGQVLAPVTATYTFDTYTDDGVRLWVNDQLIINRWNVQNASEFTGTIALTAGQKYNIRMEYWQNWGPSTAALRWIDPGSGTLVQVPTRYLFPDDSSIPEPPAQLQNLIGSMPNITGRDYEIRLSWDAVPGAHVYTIYRQDPDQTSFSYIDSVLPGHEYFWDEPEGQDPHTDRYYRYEVVVSGAGGRSSREVLDSMGSVTARAGNGWVKLIFGTAPTNKVKVERSDDGGLTWGSPAIIPSSSGVFTDYHDILPETEYTYRVCAVEPRIASAPVIVTVTTPADPLQSMMGQTSQMGELLPEGENSGTGEETTGLNAEFFDGTGLAGTAVLQTTAENVDFSWDNQSLPTGLSSKFSLRLTGALSLPAVPPPDGLYRFRINSNGGARLWIDGELVIDQWSDVPLLAGDTNVDGKVDFIDLVAVSQHYNQTGSLTRSQGDLNADGAVNFADLVAVSQTYNRNESPQSFEGAVQLDATVAHQFKLEYFNQTGGQSLSLAWAYGTSDFATIGSESFSPVADSTPPSSPATPQGFAVSSTTDTSVSLKWFVDSDAASYTVQRRDSNGGEFVNIGSSANGTFVDQKLKADRTYSYQLIAVSNSGASAPSSSVDALTKLPAPASATATVSGSTIQIGWERVGGAENYKIYRSTTGSNFSVLQTLSEDGTVSRSYPDSVTPGTRFYYYVIATRSSAPANTSVPTRTLSAVSAGVRPTRTVTISMPANPPASVQEGANYPIVLSAPHMNGLPDIDHWVIHTGEQDLLVNGNPSSANVVFADDGSYVITADAFDAHGYLYPASSASGGQLQVNVTNAPRTVSVSGADMIIAGKPYKLSLRSQDPGDDRVRNWQVQWDAGGPWQTFVGSPTEVQHVYASAGSYTISAKATDEDGEWNAAPRNVTVNAAAGATLAIPSNLHLVDPTAAYEGRPIELAWNLSQGAVDDLKLEQTNESTNETLISTLTSTATSQTITGLTPATPFRFRLRPHKGDEFSQYSNIVRLTTAPSLATPQSAWADAESTPDVVHLHWAYNGQGAPAGFRISVSKKTDPGTSTTIQIANGAARSTDYNLPQSEHDGSLFEFRIVAYNAQGESSPALFHFAPADPSGLTIINNDPSVAQDTELKLQWSDNSNIEIGQELSYTDSTQHTQKITLPANLRQYLLTGLMPGTSYSVELRAIGPEGTSQPATATGATAADHKYMLTPTSAGLISRTGGCSIDKITLIHEGESVSVFANSPAQAITAGVSLSIDVTHDPPSETTQTTYYLSTDSNEFRIAAVVNNPLQYEILWNHQYRANDDRIALVDFVDRIPISISASASSVRESADNPITFTFSRPEADSGQALTVSYVLGGTATPGVDYSKTGGTGDFSTTFSLTFPAGQSTAEVVITPAADNLVEDAESVYVHVLNGSGYAGGASAQALIEDNGPDIQVDSNNDGFINAADESVEDTDQNLAGKILSENRQDLDGDGIANLADGYNLQNGPDDDTSPHITDPVILTLPDSVDLAAGQFKWKLEYAFSDPGGVTLVGGEWKPATGGNLRIWTLPLGRANRSFTTKGTGEENIGFFVPSSADPSVGYFTADQWTLLAGEGNRTATLYLEGVKASSAGQAKIVFSVDPTGSTGFSTDQARVTVGDIDLDIDSNNTSDGEPACTPSQDLIEDQAGKTGKIIVVNDGDRPEPTAASGDGIPDFADGYNLDSTNPADDANPSDMFVPVVVAIPDWVDPSKAQFKFVYSASDPKGVIRTGSLANGGYLAAAGCLPSRNLGLKAA